MTPMAKLLPKPCIINKNHFLGWGRGGGGELWWQAFVRENILHNLIIFIIEVDIFTSIKWVFFSKCFAHWCLGFKIPTEICNGFFKTSNSQSHFPAKQKQKGKRLYTKKKKSTFRVVSSSHLILLENKNVCMTFLCYCCCRTPESQAAKCHALFFFFWGIWINESTTPNAFKFPPTEYLHSKEMTPRCVYYHCRVSYVGLHSVSTL